MERLLNNQNLYSVCTPEQRVLCDKTIPERLNKKIYRTEGVTFSTSTTHVTSDGTCAKGDTIPRNSLNLDVRGRLARERPIQIWPDALNQDLKMARLHPGQAFGLKKYRQYI